MRGSYSWTSPQSLRPARQWWLRPVVYAAMLAMFALAAGAASSERSHSDRPIVASAMAKAHSGSGNLVPVW